ncbi:MAG: hypothetical protein J6J17_03455 [Bacilli bacterium]|nr:hypothetical protein [Bacilli bacterium]
MKKIINRRFNPKSLLMGLGLVSTLIAFTGCDNKKEDKSIPSSKEITTEVTTQGLENQETTKQDIDNYEQLAIESYNKYREFYDSFEDFIVNPEKVKNMIKVINSDMDGLTEDDLADSINLINEILLSEDLCQKIDNIDLGIEDNTIVPSHPILSTYISDGDIKSDLEGYESIRDSIITSANNNSLTENDKIMLSNAIIEMEQSYNKHQGNMNSTLANEGNKYIQNAWKENLVVLAAKVTGKTEIIDENGEVYPINTTDEETMVIIEYNRLTNGGEQIPDDLSLEYANIKMRQIIDKYDAGMCAQEEELYRMIKNKKLEEPSPVSMKEQISSLEMVKKTLQEYYACENTKINSLHL